MKCHPLTSIHGNSRIRYDYLRDASIVSPVCLCTLGLSSGELTSIIRFLDRFIVTLWHFCVSIESNKHLVKDQNKRENL